MKKLFMLLVLVGLVGCQPQGGGKISKDDLRKMLAEDITLITGAIEANPAVFLESMQKAIKGAQKGMAAKREETEKKAFEQSFSNPLKPEMRSDEMFVGNKNGVITLVEYSDFECPFCSRGYKTAKDFMKAYDGKVRYVFKHLPLSFHKNAMPAAQYYEALRLQSEKMASKFHDALFENQADIKKGASYFKSVAKKLGANMKKIAKDIKSSAVQDRIAQDMKEAAKFGIQGTPGYVLNGIPIKGAYPLSHFKKIVAELQKRNLIKL